MRRWQRKRGGAGRRSRSRSDAGRRGRGGRGDGPEPSTAELDGQLSAYFGVAHPVLPESAAEAGHLPAKTVGIADKSLLSVSDTKMNGDVDDEEAKRASRAKRFAPPGGAVAAAAGDKALQAVKQEDTGAAAEGAATPAASEVAAQGAAPPAVGEAVADKPKAANETVKASEAVNGTAVAPDVAK